MKTIVTHFSPDVDAICSIWLIRKFLPGYKEAKIEFVPAGDTFGGRKADSDPSIVHADTGFGKFDHHQSDSDTCAAKLIFSFLKSKGYLKKNELIVLPRLVREVNEIDHFRQVFLKEAKEDRFEFFLDEVIDGLKLIYPQDDQEIVKIGLLLIEAIYKQLSDKIQAEKIIKEEAVRFKTVWGTGIGLLTTNDEAVHLAQKLGFKLVVRKDPRKGYVRIKSWPVPEINLTGVYNKLKEKDKEATWFLHASKHMVLNGSTKNPKMKPTTLSLEEIIEIIKKERK